MINIKIVFSILEGFPDGSNTEEHLCNLYPCLQSEKEKTGLSAISIIKQSPALSGLDTYTVHKKGSYPSAIKLLTSQL
jgi:hypothetical protein